MSETTLTIKINEGEDGWFVAECIELPGCMSQGRTIRSAVRNIAEAIRAVLLVQDRGKR